MENSFQTSFIPKKPVTSDVQNKAPRSLFSMIATFLLILSVVVSAGLFVYRIYLNKQKESLSASLAIARDSFEKETIEELSLFDKRTTVAKQILGNHLIFSKMFAMLGNITIPSIQYTDFEQQTNNGGFLVKIEGVARDYRSIALQADMFNSLEGRSFKNVLFSNLVKEKGGNIAFDLEFNIDPGILSYEDNLLVEPEPTPDLEIPQSNLPADDLNNPTQ